MEFKYAAELKKRFACYGHFYELVFMNGDRAKCRSVLEIVDTDIPREVPSSISEMEPDAVVIMMNPGSSHPKDIYHIDKEIEYPRSVDSMRKDLVLTQPDNTQYAIPSPEASCKKPRPCQRSWGGMCTASSAVSAPPN